MLILNNTRFVTNCCEHFLSPNPPVCQSWGVKPILAMPRFIPAIANTTSTCQEIFEYVVGVVKGMKELQSRSRRSQILETLKLKSYNLRMVRHLNVFVLPERSKRASKAKDVKGRRITTCGHRLLHVLTLNSKCISLTL